MTFTSNSTGYNRSGNSPPQALRLARLTKAEQATVDQAIARAADAFFQTWVMQAQHCFANASALTLGDKSGLILYHEGYYARQHLDHAWNSIHGKIVDLTWALNIAHVRAECDAAFARYFRNDRRRNYELQATISRTRLCNILGSGGTLPNFVYAKENQKTFRAWNKKWKEDEALDAEVQS